MLDGDDRVSREFICAEAVSPRHPVVNGFCGTIRYFLDIAGPSPEDVLPCRIGTINNDPLLVFGEYQRGKTNWHGDCSPAGAQQFMSWYFIYRPVGQHASIHLKIKNNGVTKVTPFIKYKDNV